MYSYYQIRDSLTGDTWRECPASEPSKVHVLGTDNRSENHALVVHNTVYLAGYWRVTPKVYRHEPTSMQRVIFKDGTEHVVLFKEDAISDGDFNDHLFDLVVSFRPEDPSQWEYNYSWAGYIDEVGHDNIKEIVSCK